jgi:Dyp-type peroxidase family
MLIEKVDLPVNDIQGLLLSGYGKLPYACYLFVQFHDVTRARAWLRKLLPAVTNAVKPEDDVRTRRNLNIAFTMDGLRLLGVTGDSEVTFTREFREGMAGRPLLGGAPTSRSRALGDTGSSAPGCWQFGGIHNERIDAVLLMYAGSEAAIEAMCEAYCPRTSKSLVREVYRQTTPKYKQTEPFGFRDGISQPTIHCNQMKPVPGETTVPAGEFLFGYEDAYGHIPFSPAVSRSTDVASVLEPIAGNPPQADFGKNGTFLVIRKLAQDVRGFWKFCESAACPAGQTPKDSDVEHVAAKLMGRWKSGAPLTLARKTDNPAFDADDPRNNVFSYSGEDPQGDRCPIGAHIRRCNPRDTMEKVAAKSIELVNRHRILRRGRPYRDLDNKEEGMMFVALNASIQRQFEFIQQTWLNNPTFAGLCNDKDPVAGDNDGTGQMILQRLPARRRLTNVPRFVTVRGGGYFFLPGIKALEYLANSTHLPERNSHMSGIGELVGTMIKSDPELLHAIGGLKDVLTKRFETLLARPALMRALFSYLREESPILRLPGLVVVSKYEHVDEVLGNHPVFSTDMYTPKINRLTGAFILGMPQNEQHDLEKSFLEGAVHEGDLNLIRTIAETEAARLIRENLPNRSIDAVGKLSLPVSVAIVEQYFGVPEPIKKSSNLQRWIRAIFRDIFLNLANDARVEAEANKASEEMAAYLKALIAQRISDCQSGANIGDSFLSRLIKLHVTGMAGLDAEVIRRLIGGAIVGVVDTTSKAIAQAIDQLLKRPNEWNEAKKLANSNDFDAVSEYVFEALRFNPQNPFLFRVCRQDYTIAADTPHATLIPAKSLVLVGTLSAMFDPSEVDNPDKFIATRNPKIDLHFGDGLHRCFGEHMGRQIIPTVIMELLKVNNVQRAAGPDGQLQYDGAFPSKMMLAIS